MIRVSCPHCRRTYRTRTEGMGKTAVCTKCHQSFRIGESRPSFEWKPTDLGEDSWIGVEPPEEKEELKHCIICEAPLEPGAVRCLACGANQVTGVVHRSRSQTAVLKPPVWSVIPVRLILVAAVIAIVGAGIYWVVGTISQKTVEMGDELADQALAARATRYLNEGGDEYAFAEKFNGQVTDENLPRFIKLASSGSPDIRRGVILLIGCGQITQLETIVNLAAEDEDDETAIDILETIGARRLVLLSGHEDERIRKSAAQSLCLLFDLQGDDETLNLLAESMSPAEKTRVLNDLCRPWPRAVGNFVVVINQAESPFQVQIEQVGRTFYLQVRSFEFRSLWGQDRTFSIPVEQWCAATGSAVDVKAVRGLVGGTIMLASPVGAEWQGTIRLTMKQKLTDPLPGFLPIEPPPAGQSIEEPIYLERRPR